MSGTGATSGPAMAAAINGVIAKIDEKARQLEKKIEDGLGWIPWLGDKILELWRWFVGKLQQLWDWLTRIFTDWGDPFQLLDTADAWSNNVGGPVSGEAQTAEAGALLVDDNWEGQAATAYTQMLVMQKAAMDKIKSVFTDGIATALGQLATGLIAYWAALIVALVALAGGIITALAAAGTIFGLPLAPFLAGTAVAVAVGAIAVAILVARTAAANTNTLLRQRLNDNVGFKDGHWPPTTVAA